MVNIIILHSNKLTGEIPSSICNLKSLQFLLLTNNNLEGPIPQCLGNLSGSLYALHLKQNHFHGLIPLTFREDCVLQSLNLNGNQFGGALPRTLVNCRQLEVLDIGNNEIKDTFPFWTETLQNLRVLVLRSNKFYGTVLLPSKTNTPFPMLQVFDIAQNTFTGSFPERYFYRFSAMIDVKENETNNDNWFEQYEESMEFVVKGLEQQMVRILKTFTTIDVSGNRFSGSIPKSIGKLNSLRYLNMSKNNFTGHIPPSLGNMTWLESLDMSFNQLDGEIPMQLTDLTFLAKLNLSMNNLVGRIPQSRQFNTFENDSYVGNQGLCGTPLTKKCEDGENSVEELAQEEDDDDDFLDGFSWRKKVEFALFGLAGVVVLISVVSLAFLFIRCKRKGKIAGKIDEQIHSAVPERISYYEIFQSTEQFNESNLIGIGSFGSVYRGMLRDGKVIAMKVFNLQNEAAFTSFEVECEVLRNIRHRNLTKVISSCSNKDFKAIVLEYMPNGNLEKWLYSHNYCLDVKQRLNIMIDVASALEYLHHGYSTPIVHCDLKPSNVLLDEDMVAHVCDFGIAKLLDDGESVLLTSTLATLGYIAPEYGLEGQVSTRSDVYSYGVMLMEIFTRKRPSDDTFGGDLSLKNWVESLLQQSPHEVIDSNLLHPDDEHFNNVLQCISAVLELALKCCAESPKSRIDMKEALSALHKIKRRFRL